MSVNYSFTGLARADWFGLFIGLTPEIIAKDDIDVEAWLDAGHSPWFKVDAVHKDDLHTHLHEQGYVIACQKSYVHTVMMVLMSVMPAPGWGLKKKNIDEAVRRILIYQEVSGPLASEYIGPPEDGGKDSNWKNTYVTEEEIRALVGMDVNFSTVSLATFRKSLDRWVDDNAKGRQYRAKKEQEKAEPANAG